jgi:hypothetical protein
MMSSISRNPAGPRPCAVTCGSPPLTFADKSSSIRQLTVRRCVVEAYRMLRELPCSERDDRAETVVPAAYRKRDRPALLGLIPAWNPGGGGRIRTHGPHRPTVFKCVNWHAAACHIVPKSLVLNASGSFVIPSYRLPKPPVPSSWSAKCLQTPPS